ncbi:MAG TPA: hypothetical protein VFC13_14130, partial [Actinomycetes bacterium]|nr:hypothetical protein [Actinomycetes bacterium]
ALRVETIRGRMRNGSEGSGDASIAARCPRTAPHNARRAVTSRVAKVPLKVGQGHLRVAEYNHTR